MEDTWCRFDMPGLRYILFSPCQLMNGKNGWWLTAGRWVYMYSSELCWGIFRYKFERKELKLI